MSRTIRILLVEDNPADVDLARETFADSPYSVQIDVAADGVEALARLRDRNGGSYRPDVILLDLNLPRKDGRAVLAELKSNVRLSTIPVIVLTSSEADSDVAESYRRGANCYISKPQNLGMFRAAIRGIEGFWFSLAKLPVAAGNASSS
jgi:CheY-like chemotaxis protein